MGRVALVTPNAVEQKTLFANQSVEKFLAENPHCSLLSKGGHGQGQELKEVLYTAQEKKTWTHPRLEGSRRGTGCVLASLIAGRKACGENLESAVVQARAQLMKYWQSTESTLGVW